MNRSRFERQFNWLVAALVACANTSAEGAAPAATAEPVYRYLFVVDTSFSMASRSANVRNSISGLIRNGINGRIKPGEPFGIWTFNERVDTATFVRLHWDLLLDQAFANKAYQFLTRLKYERQTRLDRALVHVLALARDSEQLTIFFYSDGQDRIVGTPFDAQLNSQYAVRRQELRRARAPFVTVLNVRQGEIVTAAVHAPVELAGAATEVAQVAPTGTPATAVKLPDRPEAIPGIRPPAAATEVAQVVTPLPQPTAPSTVAPSISPTEVVKSVAPAATVPTPTPAVSTVQPTVIPPPEKSQSVQTQSPAVSPQPSAPPRPVESPKVKETPKSEPIPVVVEKKPETSRDNPPVGESTAAPPTADGPTAPAARPPANAMESAPLADISSQPVAVSALEPEKQPALAPANVAWETLAPPIPVAENRGSAIPPMPTNNTKAPTRGAAPQAAVVAPGDATGGGRFLVLGVGFLAIAGFLAFLYFRGTRSGSRPSLISRSIDRDIE